MGESNVLLSFVSASDSIVMLLHTLFQLRET